MKSKFSLSTKNFFPRKISFNNLLNSEYFFHRSGPIKLALNHDRLLKRNFYVTRARPLIDQGRKPKKEESNNTEDSEDYRRDKSRIPAELNKILLKYEKKFAKQNKKFYKSKSDNDIFLSYWHNVNDLSEKKERKLMLDKYFNDTDKNSINYHTKEIKKMCENMFKTSPLLNGNKYLDIFFYYLNEFNNNYKNPKKKEYIKKKILKFLDKLKNLLDFVEVIQDTGLDSITKDVKIKNSKYKMEYEEKVKMEELKNAIMQRKADKKNIKESQKIIKKTLKTLNALEKNKNLFEDDSFPLDINSKIEKSRNFISPDNTLYSTQNKFYVAGNKNSKMDSTQSTAFYLSGKGFYEKKNKNKIFSGLNDTSQNKSNEEEKLKSEFTDDNTKFTKLKPKKINLNLHRLSEQLVENESKMSSINSLKLKNIPTKKIEKRFTLKHLTSIKPSALTKINSDKIKILTKNLTTKNVINISKKSKISFQSQLSNFSFKRQIENLKEFNSTKKKMNFNSKNKSSFDITNDIQKQNFESKNLITKSKSQLYMLYDDIKNNKKIKENNNDDLKKYFVKRRRLDESMDTLKNVYAMDIIKKAKFFTDKMDIETRTKKVFQAYLTYEHAKKLEGVRDINRKVKGLDIDYINQIIKYKSNKNESY